MRQRGRRSCAARALIAPSAEAIDARPKAPNTLTKEQRELWNQVVASEVAVWFKTAALQQLLERYCVHVSEVRWLAEKIEKAKRPGSDYDIKHLDRLMKMREREGRAATSLATKLRLTNQSRYQPTTAAVMARNAGGERKIWER